MKFPSEDILQLDEVMLPLENALYGDLHYSEGRKDHFLEMLLNVCEDYFWMDMRGDSLVLNGAGEVGGENYKVRLETVEHGRIRAVHLTLQPEDQLSVDGNFAPNARVYSYSVGNPGEVRVSFLSGMPASFEDSSTAGKRIEFMLALETALSVLLSSEDLGTEPFAIDL